MNDSLIAAAKAVQTATTREDLLRAIGVFTDLLRKADRHRDEEITKLLSKGAAVPATPMETSQTSPDATKGVTHQLADRVIRNPFGFPVEVYLDGELFDCRPGQFVYGLWWTTPSGESFLMMDYCRMTEDDDYVLTAFRNAKQVTLSRKQSRMRCGAIERHDEKGSQ